MHRHGFFIDLLNKVLPKKLYMCTGSFKSPEGQCFLNVHANTEYLGCDITCLYYQIKSYAKKVNNQEDPLHFFLVSFNRITKKEDIKIFEANSEQDRFNRLKELKPNEN